MRVGRQEAPLPYAMEPIRKVQIVDGCISCNLCEDICAEVFEVPGGKTSRVRRWYKRKLKHEDIQERVQEAADSCPVEVIQVEE